MTQPSSMKNTGFTQIKYEDAREVNYLQDFINQANPSPATLEALGLGNLIQQLPQKNPFDSIADNLYKKIVRKGYIEKPSTVSKKNKKGSDLNFYNSSDAFIDDDECCIEKKDKRSNFEDYQCLQMSIEQLYQSATYKEKVEDLIVELNKRKAEQFSIHQSHDLERFDEVKKKIKKSIKEMMTNPKTINDPLEETVFTKKADHNEEKEANANKQEKQEEVEHEQKEEKSEKQQKQEKQEKLQIN